MKSLSKFIICLLVLASACKTVKVNSPEGMAEAYRQGIKNSMYPETDGIDTNLIPITATNPNLIRKTINNEEYVLMVSWKTNNYYPDSGIYNTQKYQIWVTAAPELLNRVKKDKPKDVNLRMKQLLGLPPTGDYKIFAEFWVRPQDMFRPCPDKELDDKRCNTCFTHKDSLDPSYIKWVNDTRVSRYYQCALYDQYPWTALGYTYDWNPANKSHIGLCEFVVDVNKNIYVNKIYTTEEYLKKE